MQLTRIIKNGYAAFFASHVDLQTTTPHEFYEVFKATYPGADAVVRKSVTFFFNAAREAEIPVSSRLLAASKPRSGPTKKRTAKPATKPQNSPSGHAQNADSNGAPPPKFEDLRKPSEVLFQNFDPSEMSDEIQLAVWTLIKHFKQRGQ
jgi:hypothetical protein